MISCSFHSIAETITSEAAITKSSLTKIAVPSEVKFSTATFCLSTEENFIIPVFGTIILAVGLIKLLIAIFWRFLVYLKAGLINLFLYSDFTIAFPSISVCFDSACCRLRRFSLSLCR